MKRISTLMFALSFVLYLSTVTLAQRGGSPPTHGLDHDHGVDHDKDVNSNKTHGKADVRGDSKEGNFINRIERNPQLSQKLQALLPTTGPNSTLAGAAMGFKNQGQFIAALHVSQNLNIPFDQLKAQMMGNPPTTPPMKLGQAIHALKPDLSEKDLDNVVDKAENEAKVDERTKPVTKPTT
jgi:hypothetical protein